MCVCVKDEVAGVRRASGVHHRALPGRRLLRHSRMSPSSIALTYYCFLISNFISITNKLQYLEIFVNVSFISRECSSSFTLFHIIHRGLVLLNY